MSDEPTRVDKIKGAIDKASQKLLQHIEMTKNNFSKDIVDKCLKTKLIVSITYWTCYHSLLEVEGDPDDPMSLLMVVQEVFKNIYGEDKAQQFIDKAYTIIDNDKSTTKNAFDLASHNQCYMDFLTQCSLVQLNGGPNWDKFIYG